MATYSASADHYAYGDGNASPPWYAPEQPDFSLRAPDATAQAWAWFEGATAVLAATAITSASLTISGLGSPSTGASEVTVRGGASEDEHLPLDHDEAIGRTLTTASATASLDGETSVVIDVAGVIAELTALNGDIIQLRLLHPTNDEAGLEGLTLSLSIEYTPGDATNNGFEITPAAMTAHTTAPEPFASARPADPTAHASRPSPFQPARPASLTAHSSAPNIVTEARPAAATAHTVPPGPFIPARSSIETSHATRPPGGIIGRPADLTAHATSPGGSLLAADSAHLSAHATHPPSSANRSRRLYLTTTLRRAAITAAKR